MDREVINIAFIGLDLPSDLLDMEKFKTMGPKDKERYTKTVLKKILELNPNGITAPQISRAIYFSRASVWNHLERLVMTREAYKLEFGKSTVYFPNGKMVHPIFQNNLEVGGKSYAFFFVRNNFGDFIYLQERKRDKLGFSNVCGGIILPLEKLEDFINKLSSAKKEVNRIVSKIKS